MKNVESNDMEMKNNKAAGEAAWEGPGSGQQPENCGFWMKKEPGIDGILVTVGLCIIALLLCVVMKDSLAGFIETIVEAMTTKANTILSGVNGVPGV